VLHTRVPEALEQELKRLSVSLRIPVSNIVRAAIEDALEATRIALDTDQQGETPSAQPSWLQRVQSVRDPVEPAYGPNADSENSDAADRPSQYPSKQNQRRLERVLRSVIGFQPLTLMKSTRCAGCGREMASGDSAFVAVRDRRGPKLIVGEECIPKNDQD
jgi:hypothetical protein